ncbi:GntR family transcriptional regulator [Paraburkholderia sp. SARCC-3016]|uniref:GntR family transcriptional regulator n=1 Tax=Paraburkholderia sp. SARCC-3016 TaxID=3058611 RepID=UPI00280779B5|nr:GntR family transcriptional regulator [Paraburkholderia sp. SARCC-3016]MDQ7980603.1 GntR family transcriptional regulator [Paraburkholderia sp. SARCC-3016]
MRAKIVSAGKAAGESMLLGESTYIAIRQAILSCTLQPGSMLTEAELMDRYGVGKSTCRLALARLTHEGLVRSVPRHGYVVVPITLKDVEEVFALRLILEPEAARLAAGRVDAKALMRIDKAARGNTASKNHGNQIGFFLDGNRAFHLQIASASGNERLVRSISVLFDEMARLVALGFSDEDDSPEISGDHRLLAEALGAGDGKTASRIARRHVERFRDMTMERVLRSMKEDFEHAPLMATGR